MIAIKAAWVIVSADDVRERAAVLIDGARVADVVPWEQIPAGSSVVDRSRAIVHPGFVNAHEHQYGLLSHGIPQVGEVVDFDSFLRAYWWPAIEDRIRKQQVLITSQASMAEMIRSGITAFCDCLEGPLTETDTLIAQGEAIEAAGMRAIVSLESSERMDEANGARCLEMNAEAVDHFAARGGLVRGAICTHTTFTCPERMIARAAELAAERGAILQFHLSESKYEGEWTAAHLGRTPVSIYESAGALGPNTLAAQVVKTTPAELEVLLAHGVKTAHLPISNCEVGGGVAPVPRMLEMGFRTALGTDGYINDFYQVMRAACLIHKAWAENTVVMPAREVFRMATAYGAEAMHLSGVGTLEPGMQADLVVYEDAQFTPVARHNIFDQLVIFGNSNNVRDVYVAGRAILEDDILTTIDEERAFAELRACADAFWKGMVA
ncbi:MAG: amidohydrolase family protein [Coriobacteriaceae bacterium]|nr:amidohydrolase family protein [Coriobacteriaceae bacterium]